MNRSLLCGLMLTALPALSFAQGGVVEYYHLDALGTVRAVTNESGTVLERHDYLPFGEELCPSGGTYIVCGGSPAGQSKRFTGKERDTETGLDYFGARYLRANAGRFTTIDPVYTWQENLVDPQRWNRYAYARNNPPKYVDPDGRAIDVIADVGFILYDLYDIGSSAFGGRGVSGTQVAALGADILGAAIPFATGGGAAIRAGARIDNAIDSGKGASNIVDGGKASGGRTLKPGPHATEAIPARGPQRDFTAAERAEINRIGGQAGCHTCGTTSPGTRSGNFVPDHQPPSSLNKGGASQELRPHCIGCSRTQGGEVTKVLREEKK